MEYFLIALVFAIPGYIILSIFLINLGFWLKGIKQTPPQLFRIKFSTDRNKNLINSGNTSFVWQDYFAYLSFILSIILILLGTSLWLCFYFDCFSKVLFASTIILWIPLSASSLSLAIIGLINKERKRYLLIIASLISFALLTIAAWFPFR
jgi:hypothetical protein